MLAIFWERAKGDVDDDDRFIIFTAFLVDVDQYGKGRKEALEIISEV